MGLIRPWLQDTTITDLRDHKTQPSPPTASHHQKQRKIRYNSNTHIQIQINTWYICTSFTIGSCFYAKAWHWQFVHGCDFLQNLCHQTNLGWFCTKNISDGEAGWLGAVLHGTKIVHPIKIWAWLEDWERARLLTIKHKYAWSANFVQFASGWLVTI